MRLATEVQAEIEATRAALLAADEAAGTDWTPAAWDLGTVLLEQLTALSAEYASIPHPRLPSDTDGHSTPKAV